MKRRQISLQRLLLKKEEIISLTETGKIVGGSLPNSGCLSQCNTLCATNCVQQPACQETTPQTGCPPMTDATCIGTKSGCTGC
jgi:hypothetical protein